MVTEIRTPFGTKYIYRDNKLYKIEEFSKREGLMLIMGGGLDKCLNYLCDCFKWNRAELEVAKGNI